MMLRVDVATELLIWALERSGREPDDLMGRFPRLQQWLLGDVQPTLKQLESFSKAVYVPLGYLFLLEPPKETTPIPDLRTMGSADLSRISPNLLDTIYLCQNRQAWYRDYARTSGEDTCDFVGSTTVNSPVESTAAMIRAKLGFDLEQRRSYSTWTDALREFISQAESAGVLVMVSGVVGNNNRRKLDPEEFRGFAIADEYAPLVFINGADTKAAQMFTLAHELAHLWLGESALSDVDPHVAPGHRIEQWCNSVAAEVLVPQKDFALALPKNELLHAKQDLARRYKVSTLVIIRRMFDIRRLTFDEYRDAYEEERARLMAIKRAGGGDFYLTQPARASKRFVKALVVSTLEGHTLYKEAYSLLGIKKSATFEEFGHRMGIIA